MRTAIYALLLSVCCFSCSRRYDQTTSFYEDGRAKPMIAITSMLDTTSFDVSWNLSEELTGKIANAMGQTGEMVVHAMDDSPFSENPFGNDLSWMKREFQGEEFVAFSELVEHHFVPSRNDEPFNQVSTNLNMAVRVRIVDLRAQKPKVVLQEMIKYTYFVPKTLAPVDYTYVTYGSEDYEGSPMGIAHAILANEIANRMSDYVFLAK